MGAWEAFAGGVGNLAVPALIIAVAVWLDRRMERRLNGIQAELTDVNVRLARIEGGLAATGFRFSPEPQPAQPRPGQAHGSARAEAGGETGSRRPAGKPREQPA